MAQVLGVGGFFFKSRDPEALGEWYQKWLNMTVSGGAATFKPVPAAANGVTVWSAFPADTDYFGRADQAAMVNLIVDDVHQALEQVRQGGGEVVDEMADEQYGKFGWFVDPEGNRVELWQPPSS